MKLAYTALTHWVKVEVENHDFYAVVDDMGNMVEVCEDANLWSLTGFYL